MATNNKTDNQQLNIQQLVPNQKTRVACGCQVGTVRAGYAQTRGVGKTIPIHTKQLLHSKPAASSGLALGLRWACKAVGRKHRLKFGGPFRPQPNGCRLRVVLPAHVTRVSVWTRPEVSKIAGEEQQAIDEADLTVTETALAGTTPLSKTTSSCLTGMAYELSTRKGTSSVSCVRRIAPA